MKRSKWPGAALWQCFGHSARPCVSKSVWMESRSLLCNTPSIYRRNKSQIWAESFHHLGEKQGAEKQSGEETSVWEEDRKCKRASGLKSPHRCVLNRDVRSGLFTRVGTPRRFTSLWRLAFCAFYELQSVSKFPITSRTVFTEEATQWNFDEGFH